MRNTGIILSLLGIALGALAVVFSVGYQPAQGFLGSLPAMEVVLKPGTPVTRADEPLTAGTAFYHWEDAEGKAQTSARPPLPSTEVRKFRVTTQSGNRWSDRPGRVRTELRDRKTVALRTVLAAALVLTFLGLGMALLARRR